jgi:hypothetical protein
MTFYCYFLLYYLEKVATATGAVFIIIRNINFDWQLKGTGSFALLGTFGPYKLYKIRQTLEWLNVFWSSDFVQEWSTPIIIASSG